MNKFKLTTDQEIAINKVKSFLEDPNCDVFTLSGIGGAGKTSCIKEALKNRSNIIGAAISHSAKFVLEQSLRGIAGCVTVAQLLGLVQVIQEDGDIKFLPKLDRNPDFPLPIETHDIIIIDECSMIDPTIYDLIINLKSVNAKVIFLGGKSPK